MIDLIQEPLSVLCDEVGVPVPQPDARGICTVVIDNQELRFVPLKQGKVVMLGIIGNAEALAAKRNEDLQIVLASCLTLQGARFAKLGTREVMTLEPETGELVLWQSFDPSTGVSISSFLGAAESMLNEVEYWKNWLAAS